MPSFPLRLQSAILTLACGMILPCQGQETAPAERKGETDEGKDLPPLTKVMEQATVFARQATEAMRRQDWKKAAEMWDEVLKLQPDSAAALSNLGAVEMRLDKLDAARTHLEKAITLRPNLAATWMTLGLLHQERKNPMLAISCLTRAVHEDPVDPRLHNALATALKHVGWTNGAEQELQKAVDLAPDFAEAHFNLALLYLEQKPPALEMARRHYLRSRDLGAAPDDLVEKQLGDAGTKPGDPNSPKDAGKPAAPDKVGPAPKPEKPKSGQESKGRSDPKKRK